MLKPLYTPENCRSAFQLRWSLSVFSKKKLPLKSEWISELQPLVERDGIRILEARDADHGIWQFLLSTTPELAPPEIVKSVKGRMQHYLRTSQPDLFRRNFQLASVGDGSRSVVERYVSSQLAHHRMCDGELQRSLEDYQISNSLVDLGTPRNSAHGQYLYNLHLVIVHVERWPEVRVEQLDKTRTMILQVAAKKGHLLTRAGVLADHLHLTLGCQISESPKDVALAYLNNLAFAHGMRPQCMFGYYVGTFGEYDMGAVWNSLAASQGSTDTGSVVAGQRVD